MIYKAPQLFPTQVKTVFLAGAIDMGHAVNWQAEAEKYLDRRDRCILNPRRDDWDSSCKQDVLDDQFRTQVLWELRGLECAEVVLVVFTKDSKAPITMLELGLYHKKAVIVVEPGFYRKGNIDILTWYYGLTKFENLEDGLYAVNRKLENL